MIFMIVSLWGFLQTLKSVSSQIFSIFELIWSLLTARKKMIKIKKMMLLEWLEDFLNYNDIGAVN